MTTVHADVPHLTAAFCHAARKVKSSWLGSESAGRRRAGLTPTLVKTLVSSASRAISSKPLSANHARICGVRSGRCRCRVQITVAPRHGTGPVPPGRAPDVAVVHVTAPRSAAAFTTTCRDAMVRTHAAALGMVVVSQPRIPVGPGRRVCRGLRRSGVTSFSFASWQRGITVAGSSDAPVITPDPLIGIRDAILRRTSDGRLWAARTPARPRRARPVHHPGRLRLPPRERDRLARAGQARRLHRPGQEPAGVRTRADPRHPGAGHRPRRNPRLPILRHLPRPLTGPGLLSKQPATAPAQGLRRRACAPGHRGPPSSAAPASRVPANGHARPGPNLPGPRRR